MIYSVGMCATGLFHSAFRICIDFMLVSECSPSKWFLIATIPFFFHSSLPSCQPTYFWTQKFLPDQNWNWNFLIEKMDSFNLLSKFSWCKKLFSQFFSDCLARCPSRIGKPSHSAPRPQFKSRFPRPREIWQFRYCHSNWIAELQA